MLRVLKKQWTFDCLYFKECFSSKKYRSLFLFRFKVLMSLNKKINAIFYKFTPLPYLISITIILGSPIQFINLKIVVNLSGDFLINLEGPEPKCLDHVMARWENWKEILLFLSEINGLSFYFYKNVWKMKVIYPKKHSGLS